MQAGWPSRVKASAESLTRAIWFFAPSRSQIRACLRGLPLVLRVYWRPQMGSTCYTIALVLLAHTLNGKDDSHRDILGLVPGQSYLFQGSGFGPKLLCLCRISRSSYREVEFSCAR
jgi:hypothetical protein